MPLFGFLNNGVYCNEINPWTSFGNFFCLFKANQIISDISKSNRTNVTSDILLKATLMEYMCGGGSADPGTIFTWQ